MKQKELWAQQHDRAYCMAEVELPENGGGPYGDSWLAGFEFAKKQFKQELSPHTSNGILDTRGVLLLLERMGNEELNK